MEFGQKKYKRQESLPKEAAIMNLALRGRIAISFVFVLTPGVLLAQQLRQPTSLLPWVAPTTDTAKPLPNIEALLELQQSEIPREMPVCMSTATPEADTQPPSSKKLPFVEQHNFSNLGNVLNGTAHQSLASRPVTAPSRSVDRSHVSSSPVAGRTEIAAPLQFFHRVR